MYPPEYAAVWSGKRSVTVRENNVILSGYVTKEGRLSFKVGQISIRRPSMQGTYSGIHPIIIFAKGTEINHQRNLSSSEIK